MPRKARVLVPNCPHHIVQRGHNKNTVFATDEDFEYYLENMQEFCSTLNIKVYAWCLMTNHIHLLIEPQDDVSVISDLMSRINGRQTRHVNKLEGRTGSLWEGRFKASPVQTDSYLMACCRYIELNPVRAGMVVKPSDYPWSSFAERSSGDLRLLDQQTLQAVSGWVGSARLSHYRDYVESEIPEGETTFITESFKRNQLTGSSRFIDEIEQKIGLRIEHRSQGRPRK